MRGAGLLAASLSLAALASGPARPYQGDGACLSCHGKALPVLPGRPCLSCHAGNMDFAGRESPASPSGVFLAVKEGGRAKTAVVQVFGSSAVVWEPGPVTVEVRRVPEGRSPASALVEAAR